MKNVPHFVKSPITLFLPSFLVGIVERHRSRCRNLFEKIMSNGSLFKGNLTNFTLVCITLRDKAYAIAPILLFSE